MQYSSKKFLTNKLKMSAKNVFLKYDEEHQLNESGPSSKPSNDRIRQTLDQIFPPLETAENGNKLHVSTKQAAIFEILDLEIDLESKLKDVENAVQGFSPEISEIYQQLFQELIRQVNVKINSRLSF